MEILARLWLGNNLHGPTWEKGKVNEEGEKGKERMREKWEAVGEREELTRGFLYESGFPFL